MSNLTLEQFESLDTRTIRNKDDFKIFIEDFYYSHEDITHWDLSKWQISSFITDFSYLFSNCSNLISLNLSNWSTTHITSVKYMFRRCFNLSDLRLDNWSIESLTEAAHALDDTKLDNKEFICMVEISNDQGLREAMAEKKRKELRDRRNKEALEIVHQIIEKEQKQYSGQARSSSIIQEQQNRLEQKIICYENELKTLKEELAEKGNLINELIKRFDDFESEEAKRRNKRQEIFSIFCKDHSNIKLEINGK